MHAERIAQHRPRPSCFQGVPRLRDSRRTNYWTEAQHGINTFVVMLHSASCNSALVPFPLVKVGVTAEVTVAQPSSSSPDANTLTCCGHPDCLLPRCSDGCARGPRQAPTLQCTTAIARLTRRAERCWRASPREHTCPPAPPPPHSPVQVTLSLFAPEMNVVRAPLWGRAQEACGGEEPTAHAARHSAAFVRGLQVPRHPLPAARHARSLHPPPHRRCRRATILTTSSLPPRARTSRSMCVRVCAPPEDFPVYVRACVCGPPP